MLGKNSRAVYLNEFLQDQVEDIKKVDFDWTAYDDGWNGTSLRVNKKVKGTDKNTKVYCHEAYAQETTGKINRYFLAISMSGYRIIIDAISAVSFNRRAIRQQFRHYTQRRIAIQIFSRLVQAIQHALQDRHHYKEDLYRATQQLFR